ncbi:MAG: DMT family transporter [Planctomycetes bacterium]|nr:DMT family transporter [Planctomycetota bacterium]MCB9936325.1 DMT family transporter [Planctomycetota bacterium]
MTAREWGLLGSLSVLWGGSFLFIELGLRDFGPMSLVFLRLALAALALHVALRPMRVKLPGGRAWGWYFLLGLFNNALPFALMFWGLTRIGGALASMLNATTPLFTVVLAHFMTRDERMTLNRLAGCLLGVVGVGVMVGREALSGEGELLAYLAVLGAGVCYALAGIFGRKVGQVPPLALATGQLTAAAMLIAPLAALEQPWNATPGWQSLASLVALALVSTSFAYVLYFKLLKAAGATNILLVTLLVPVSSTLLCVPLLGEVLEWRQVAGMAVIALGLLLVDGRILRRP